MMSYFQRAQVIRKIFNEIPDPRSPRNKQHLLIEIIVITICAVICGADGWEGIETFAKERKEWLSQFLQLPYGVPGHDTFRRVFACLNPKALQKSFRCWVNTVFRFTKKQVIAVDGKSLRHSYEHGEGKHKGMLHMVSAWAAENALVLGQLKTIEKSNEITAIPELLDVLAIKGCIVTIDAMGCQRKIAEQIVKQEADYILAVKENQGALYQAIQQLFEKSKMLDLQNMCYDQHEEVDAGHGRIETRLCTTLPLMYLPTFKLKWKGLQSIILIESRREIKEQIQTEKRYYVSSLPAQAQPMMSYIRQHWGIENQLHWVLDVVFREDDSRIRKGNGAENMAVIRHMAINLMKQDKSNQFSIRKKRYMATLNVAYLEKILESA